LVEETDNPRFVPEPVATLQDNKESALHKELEHDEKLILADKDRLAKP
jgi:hypothetical protein